MKSGGPAAGGAPLSRWGSFSALSGHLRKYIRAECMLVECAAIVLLGFVLLLAGCAEHWQNVASGARSDIIACNNAKNNADSWGVFYYCDKANGVPLPPECLVSDDAARSPKCVAIAKGEAMTGAVTSTGQTAITAGTLFVH
jgi:hypothetical protein